MAYTPHPPGNIVNTGSLTCQIIEIFYRNLRTEAISSIKAPVPPAQLPFIRISATFTVWEVSSSRKKIIFASCPPSSMAVPIEGYCVFRASAFAATSWINVSFSFSAIGFAPDPSALSETFSLGNAPSARSAQKRCFLPDPHDACGNQKKGSCLFPDLSPPTFVVVEPHVDTRQQRFLFFLSFVIYLHHLLFLYKFTAPLKIPPVFPKSAAIISALFYFNAFLFFFSRVNLYILRFILSSMLLPDRFSLPFWMVSVLQAVSGTHSKRSVLPHILPEALR